VTVISITLRRHRASTVRAAVAAATAGLVACGGSAPPPPARTQPATAAPTQAATYDQQNGKLQELDFDRNGDGKVDTRAYMDGVLIKSIEIDRNGTGKPDRWEYYEPVTSGAVPAGSPDGHSVITRAEEANGKNGKITRHEFYENGLISRVEEDTDGDGKVDKWETYEGGLVATVELDLNHRGRPQRRFVYGPDGSLERVETDAKGDGNFKPSAMTSKDLDAAQPGHAPGRAGKGGG
jgi:hypothetical protein